MTGERSHIHPREHDSRYKDLQRFPSPSLIRNVVPAIRYRAQADVQSGKAVAALKALDNRTDFEGQLTLLLKTIATWAMDREDLSDVYLTLGDTGFLFLAMMSGVEYNPDLEDSLSELDLMIANDHDLDMIRLDVMALPKTGPVALDSFLSNDFNLKLIRG